MILDCTIRNGLTIEAVGVERVHDARHRIAVIPVRNKQ